jgi:hypothetical protein
MSLGQTSSPDNVNVLSVIRGGHPCTQASVALLVVSVAVKHFTKSDGDNQL